MDNVKQAGAATIGLTLYPTYPAESFKNTGMYPYGHQNGGDWPWFGWRMIQQLIQNGFEREARQQLEPMLQRVIDNNGFYEWYTVDNQPQGSGTFWGASPGYYTTPLGCSKSGPLVRNEANFDLKITCHKK